MTEEASAIICLTLLSEKIASILSQAIQPEINTSVRKRSNVYVNQKRKTLTLSFKAHDTTALRASLNSYLSWLHLMNDFFNTLKDH